MTHMQAAPLEQVKAVRADQYGIRTTLRVDGQSIQFEVVLAMMKPALPLLRQAVRKAQAAYGAAIRQDLDKALLRLKKSAKAGWSAVCKSWPCRSPRRWFGSGCGRCAGADNDHPVGEIQTDVVSRQTTS